MQPVWVLCPVCKRRLFKMDGHKIHVRCRGSKENPRCRAIVEVDTSTGKTHIRPTHPYKVREVKNGD